MSIDKKSDNIFERIPKEIISTLVDICSGSFMKCNENNNNICGISHIIKDEYLRYFNCVYNENGECKYKY